MPKLFTYFGHGLLYIVLIPYYVVIYSFFFLLTTLTYIGGEVISFFSFLNGKKHRNTDKLGQVLEDIFKNGPPANLTPSPYQINYSAFSVPNQQQMQTPPIINPLQGFINPQPQVQIPPQQTMINVTPINPNQQRGSDVK